MTDAPVEGRKLGRIAPTHEQLRNAPRLFDLLKAPLDMSGTPDECDNITGAPISMNGNNTDGDCTVAAFVNYFAIIAHALGRPFVSVVAKVLAFYRKLTGGPDTGLPETIVMQAVTIDGVDCAEDGELRKIALWVRVPTQNHALMRFLIWKFKAVYVGAALSNNDCKASSWTVPASLTGDDATNPDNGHAFLIARFGKTLPDGDTPTGCVTWGEDMPSTLRWADLRVQEGYVYIDEDLAQDINFDWDGALTIMQNMPAT